MRKDGLSGYQGLKKKLDRKNEIIKEAADLIAELFEMKPSPIKIAGIDMVMKAINLMTKLDQECEK